MALCSSTATGLAVAWRSSREWTPEAGWKLGKRKQHSIVCKSNSSRKRSTDKSGPDQHLKTQEGPVSDTNTGIPRNSEQEVSRSGKPIGWKVLPREESEQSPGQQQEHSAVPDEGSASRGQVFWACASTSAVLCGFAWVLRARAPVISVAALHTDPAAIEDLLRWPQQLDAAHAGIAVACAALVTAARLQLLQRWPAFAEATELSNSQVMPQLEALDILWLAALPGISEELLFRGALIPSLYPDWRGVVISGVGFGLLHNSGGRNLAFAAWASLVGILYGGAFLYTQDIFVPMVSHSLANAAAGVLWRQGQGMKDM